MTNEFQLAANRRNSQLSTGPKTETGKHRTRLNAYRHGLTGQVQIFTPEDQVAFDLHCKGIVEALAPVGALEQNIAQSVAEDRWRLMRIRAIEAGIFAIGQSGGYSPAGIPERDTHGELLCAQAICQAEAWLAKGTDIALLGTYQNRIQRTIDRGMAELRTLRAERQAARKQALEEAQLLAQQAQSKAAQAIGACPTNAESYDPAADFPPELLQPGFDFSTGEIQRQLDRNARLHQARKSQNAIPAAA